ncbi:hypothetical protein ACFV5E_25380 [Streptomyces chartreusis]|uniref:hypothetical protein n=1 Tax=Streptomyces chartreusis TaxID=1969 RepID=UPI00368097BD
MPLEEAQDELKHLLVRCERWLRAVDEVSDLLPDARDLGSDVERMEALRTRALSTMLKVALLGRQPSGKSFLISGLQGGLEYLPFIDEDGEQSDEYVGILPSSASPTTACPSTVIPVGDDPTVDAYGRGQPRDRQAPDARRGAGSCHRRRRAGPARPQPDGLTAHRITHRPVRPARAAP